MSDKTAVLLLNMGGPATLDDVDSFLYNLFSDPDIIRLPFSSLLQKPLAWLIAKKRHQEAIHNYASMGGGSPILKYTQAQASGLRQLSGCPVYIAMRYAEPFTTEAVRRLQQDGIQHVIALPLYPHFSYTTVGSSLNELKRVMQQEQAQFTVHVAPPYWEHAGYQAALAQTIREGLAMHTWSCPPEQVQVLFTAHSLPIKHIQRTQDPYPHQIQQCARQIMDRYFPQNSWDLAFQSQVGRMKWLGPRTDGVLHFYAGKKIENVLMVALSFVSDHVETLVEIDRLYAPLGREIGVIHCERAPALNENALFIQALADVALQVKNAIPGKQPDNAPNHRLAEAVS